MKKNKTLVRGRLKVGDSQSVSHHLWGVREGPHFQIRAHPEGWSESWATADAHRD